MPHDPRWHPDRFRSEQRPQREGPYSRFERFAWRDEDRTPDYFGTGTHFGGGYGTAPGTRTSGEGNAGALGYGREGAWSENWTPRADPFAEGTHVDAPSYRGRGPKGYARSDERLREIICERLTDDPRIDASDVSVEVNQGVVRLTGVAPERRMKYAIEDLIERCGAKDVDNQLRVQARPLWT